MHSISPKAVARAALAVTLLLSASVAFDCAADAATTGRNLDVVLVVDHALYVQLGSSESAAQDFAASVLAGITPITGPDLQLRVQSVGVIVESVADGWTASASSPTEVSSSSLLTNFTAWAAANVSTPRDETVLLSGRDFDGSTVGLAGVGSACNGPAAGAIIQATFAASYVTTIVAHELGHTLGMSHDGSGNACPQSGFIMSGVGCSNCALPTHYSSCSISSFATWFPLSGGCLLDDVPACGNGVHQAGEQCDCGADCGTDSCCTPWYAAGGCALDPGCTCAVSDGCCVNGAPAPAGSSCRAAASTCDIAEQCDGTSPFCPPDLHVPVGTACGTDGVCGPAGVCESASAQCIATGPLFGISLVGSCSEFTTCSNLVCMLSDGTCTSFIPPYSIPADGIPCGAGSVCAGGTCGPVANLDACPHDPAKTAEGVCGCGVPDVDTDGDGLADCIDRCPFAGTGVSPGILCTFWSTGAFSTCSAPCGGGTQTRSVTCTDGVTSFPDTACADVGPKPASEETCNSQPCEVDQTILGNQIKIIDPKPGVPTKRGIVVVAKEVASPNTLVGDPTVAGASLTVSATGGSSSSQTVPLPAGGWTTAKGGFKYKDAALAFGPVKAAQVKLAKGTFLLKAALLGKTGAISVVPPNPGTDACVVFAISGGGRYDVRYPAPPDATFRKNDATAFQVKGVTVEGLCP